MSLFIIFFVALYTFIPREETGENIDSVKTKLSSIRKSDPVEHKTTLSKMVEEEKVAEIVEEEENDPELSSHEEETLAASESQDSIPWDDIEKGWESEMKETLTRLDPEDGEAMYNAYLSERENHKSEVDSLFSENKDDKTRAPSMIPEGTDEAISALDTKHEERLKEILGSHYEEINKRHQEYLESIQHLNREGLEGDIGISL